ncbi:MAG TPA: DNA-formamidopyrimidine glycosylase family protein [Vicinamibacteria bacterium]|nr:DNA-formamidopyrimidine glycosylase family protein [Vicinamibacteria bacterium]
MPELPDLLHIRNRLEARLKGRIVTSERVREPVVMRFAVRGNLSLLLGRPLEQVGRRGAAILLRFEGFDLAVDPMLAGRFRFAEPGEKDPASLAFALGFGDVELRYLDDKKMGKAYLIVAGDFGAIPALRAGGADILSHEFSRERFVSLLRRRRDQVRAFLLDKKALDTIGNAYADEILFEAGIHPKTWCRAIDHDGAVRLHAAIVSVMKAAIDEVARRDEPLDVKVRDFLKVRLKDTCPRCGSRLRTAGVKGMDAYFCPTCQPATRPGFLDWRKTGV